MNQINQSLTVSTELQQENDKLVITHLQNMNSILEFNYEAKKRSNDIWQAGDKDIKFIGRVPALVYDDWEKNGITKDQKAYKKALELWQGGVLKGTKKRV